ncbi:hypothetical protein THF5H11_10247 [Vibrio jasicida]|nr:hypothetical protein THF5H11_10247 [Vibrio jasicida]
MVILRFRHYRNAKRVGAFSYIPSLSKSPCHLVGAVTDGSGNTHWLVVDMPWKIQSLYIFDLYESLRIKNYSSNII